MDVWGRELYGNCFFVVIVTFEGASAAEQIEIPITF